MAETMADEQPTRPRTVFARHAASVLLVRKAAAGPEVLMGVRAAGHRFVPNRLVFPGGAVDLADRTAPAASEPRAETLAILRRSVGPLLARAIVMAGARELQEETGLSFGSPPQLDRLHYLCRAITPARSPIRFNARFLVAQASDATGAPANSRELLDVRYVPVRDAAGLDMMAVTRWVLAMLAAWLAQPPAERAALDRLQVFRNERARPERVAPARAEP